jgi:hypothetical protein
VFVSLAMRWFVALPADAASESHPYTTISDIWQPEQFAALTQLVKAERVFPTASDDKTSLVDNIGEAVPAVNGVCTHPLMITSVVSTPFANVVAPRVVTSSILAMRAWAWVVVWLCGCVAAWLRGCVAAWLRGCVVAWLCGCVVAWLRLCGCACLCVAACVNACVRACPCLCSCVRGARCVVSVLDITRARHVACADEQLDVCAADASRRRDALPEERRPRCTEGVA